MTETTPLLEDRLSWMADDPLRLDVTAAARILAAARAVVEAPPADVDAAITVLALAFDGPPPDSPASDTDIALVNRWPAGTLQPFQAQMIHDELVAGNGHKLDPAGNEAMRQHLLAIAHGLPVRDEDALREPISQDFDEDGPESAPWESRLGEVVANLGDPSGYCCPLTSLEYDSGVVAVFPTGPLAQGIVDIDRAEAHLLAGGLPVTRIRSSIRDTVPDLLVVSPARLAPAWADARAVKHAADAIDHALANDEVDPDLREEITEVADQFRAWYKELDLLIDDAPEPASKPEPESPWTRVTRHGAARFGHSPTDGRDHVDTRALTTIVTHLGAHADLDDDQLRVVSSLASSLDSAAGDTIPVAPGDLALLRRALDVMLVLPEDVRSALLVIDGGLPAAFVDLIDSDDSAIARDIARVRHEG